ncbi:hypothetical protein V8B55DRAFT_1328469 [Mucor lusitanicus]|uniref:Uncharacterized protein n=2 Tax=Mucor circinelloides f. lusitanicus TaxID=29924 RepID=A0A162MUD4_MUCCL|nr:hypothetical protein FB192DRAFT_1443299 [Mucor lusitanicus]OAD05545.1 hypothetical protein MUCCIDRAFT_109415 [Mucor lusitanicus CBS 277.49]
MSYRPWRDEQIELLDINAEAIVKEHQLEIANAYQEFNQLEDDQLEAFMRQLMQDRNDEKDQGRGRGNGDRVANEDDFGRYTTEIDDSEEGDYQQNADITEDLNPRAIQPRATYFEKIKVAGKTPDDEYYELLARPNTKQRLFLTHVMHHVRNNKDDIFVRYFDSSVVPPSNNTFSPMHLLVTGVAGTGKNTWRRRRSFSAHQLE